MSRQFISFEHINLEYANSIAGMGTHGFPSIGAFLGFCENLNISIRKINKDIHLGGVLILSHNIEEQIYSVKGKIFGFKQKKAGLDVKKLEAKPILEEGYAHADLSLIVELKTESTIYNENEKNTIRTMIYDLAKVKRIAGGNIISINECNFINEENLRTKLFELYPFSALVNASSYFLEFMQQNNISSKLDGLLSLCSIHYECNKDPNTSDTDKKIEWNLKYKKSNYLVPIHIGYKAISDDFRASKTVSLRSDEYDATFVEPVFSLGEWICSATKLYAFIQNNFEDAFWDYCPNGHFYLFSKSFESNLNEVIDF